MACVCVRAEEEGREVTNREGKNAGGGGGGGGREGPRTCDEKWVHVREHLNENVTLHISTVDGTRTVTR